MNLPWHLYLMAVLYILAGLNHFKNPGVYERIIPPYLPNPKLLNIVSGIAEIIFGILLMIPFTTPFAAWAIIALLIAVFPANIYMFCKKKGKFSLFKFILLIRLPLQIVLIVWAYLYTH